MPGADDPTKPSDRSGPSRPVPALGRARILFVDLLRLLASFQMVHGHTLDALMADELRSGVAFDRWSWSRGLVSVGFMFAAGFAFSLSTLDRFEKHRTDGRTKYRRFRRIAWLITLGYLLHFPAGLLEGGAALEASLREFQIVDVLQCIGFSVLLLQLLTLTLASPRHVVWASAGFAALFFTLAPVADAVSPEGPLPRWFANYLTHSGGSLFPLFPWAGFVMSGVACAGLVLPHGLRTAPEVPFPRLVAIALVVLGLSVLSRTSPWTLTTDATSYQALPWFVLTKLGTVLAIVAILALIGRFGLSPSRWREGSRQDPPKLPRVLQILAGESLMLYAFHLIVLYGSGVGLYRLVGRTLPIGTALAVAFAMVAFTAMVGLGWHRLKAWWRVRAPSGLV